MGNMMMMNAMTGGDLFSNDFAKDMGNMMMMGNMMRPPMMGGMGMHPYGAAAYNPYYYAHPTTTTSTTTVHPAASSGFGSRITGKRGSIFDGPWGMSLLQSMLNPSPQSSSNTGVGMGNMNNMGMGMGMGTNNAAAGQQNGGGFD